MFHINLWVHSCPHLSKVGDQRWNLTSCCLIVPGRYTGEKNTHAFLDFKDRLRFYQHLQAQMHIARVSCHCDRLRIHFFTQRRLWILSLISFCVIPVQWISSLPVWIENKETILKYPSKQTTTLCDICKCNILLVYVVWLCYEASAGTISWACTVTPRSLVVILRLPDNQQTLEEFTTPGHEIPPAGISLHCTKSCHFLRFHLCAHQKHV